MLVVSKFHQRRRDLREVEQVAEAVNGLLETMRRRVPTETELDQLEAGAIRLCELHQKLKLAQSTRKADPKVVFLRLITYRAKQFARTWP